MAPLRSSTPIQKKKSQDFCPSNSSSLDSISLDSIITIDLIDSSDEEDQMELDSRSEQSQWGSSYASTQDTRKTESMDSIDMSAEGLDYNGNDVCTSSIEANYQPVVNAPQQSAYKNVLLSDQFSDFIEQELKKVTEEIEMSERYKTVDKGAFLLLNCSHKERFGGAEFKK